MHGRSLLRSHVITAKLKLQYQMWLLRNRHFHVLEIHHHRFAKGITRYDRIIMLETYLAYIAMLDGFHAAKHFLILCITLLVTQE